MNDRQAALDAALKVLEKNFGAGAVMRMDNDSVQAINVIPTGSLLLDRALGVGGYPRGRIIEIFGPPSSGKSTLTLHAVANVQKTGGTAAILDTEYALDPIYAQALGVDLENLVISQPSTAEESWEIADVLVKSGGIDLLVVDSLAAMVPRAELENDYGSSNVGLHARIISQAMRKITGPLSQTQTTAILVNQLRSTIQPFGPQETTTGGRAVPFYASVRLDCRRVETLKQGDEAVANKTRIKVVKNKTAPPLKVCDVEIHYGEGVSRAAELLDLALEFGLVQKSGAWFKHEGSNVAQGRVKAIEWLKADSVVADSLEAQIRERL